MATIYIPPSPSNVAAITSGTIDGAVIGGVNPVAGTFTALKAASLTGTGLNLTVTPLAPTVAQNAGTLRLDAQNATGATKNGGTVRIDAGNGLTTGIGGPVNITAGSGSTGGQINLNAGVGNTGIGADINVIAGDGVTGGGNVIFQGGNASGIGATAGAVTFFGGSDLSAGGIGGDMTFLPGGGSATNGTLHLASQNGGDAITITDNLAASQMSFFGGAVTLQPTAAIAGAVHVAGAGAIALTDTYDGYTIAQVVKALRNLGLLA